MAVSHGYVKYNNARNIDFLDGEVVNSHLLAPTLLSPRNQMLTFFCSSGITLKWATRAF